MSDAQPMTADNDPLWRLRWMMLASGVVTLLALVALAVDIDHGWSWGLFLWGLVVGVLAAAGASAVIGRTLSRSDIDEDRRRRFERRRVIYACSWMMASLVAGTLAAMFDQVWIDIVLTAYVVVVVGVMVLFYLRLRRRVG